MNPLTTTFTCTMNKLIQSPPHRTPSPLADRGRVLPHTLTLVSLFSALMLFLLFPITSLAQHAGSYGKLWDRSYGSKFQTRSAKGSAQEAIAVDGAIINAYSPVTNID